MVPEQGAPSRRTLPLARARRVAARVLARLAQDREALRLAPTGALRRMVPHVPEVDLLATALDPQALLARFLELPFVAEVRGRTAAGARVRLEDGTAVSLSVLEDDDRRFAGLRLETSAAPPHLAALARRAVERGLVWGPAGLWRAGERLALDSEEALYEALGLPWCPPELREDGSLRPPPGDLVAMEDLRGAVHLHTTAGAGAHDAAQMTERARREGFAWAVLADRGLEAADLARQRVALEASAAAPEDEAPPCRAFLGVEVEVAPGGCLEASDAVLAAADLVVAVPGADPGDAARALSAPAVKVLAHPRAPHCESWAADLEAWVPILRAAARHHVALEISGGPAAAPLPVGLAAAARDHAVALLPAADAHDLGAIEDVVCAVGWCRRGRCGRDEILGTLDADDFAAWLAQGRS